MCIGDTLFTYFLDDDMFGGGGGSGNSVVFQLRGNQTHGLIKKFMF